MLDLNSLLADTTGWELTSAIEINNLGQIIGSGLLNGEQRGFVLTPIPEPVVFIICDRFTDYFQTSPNRQR